MDIWPVSIYGYEYRKAYLLLQMEGFFWGWSCETGGKMGGFPLLWERSRKVGGNVHIQLY